MKAQTLIIGLALLLYSCSEEPAHTSRRMDQLGRPKATNALISDFGKVDVDTLLKYLAMQSTEVQQDLLLKGWHFVENIEGAPYEIPNRYTSTYCFTSAAHPQDDVEFVLYIQHSPFSKATTMLVCWTTRSEFQQQALERVSKIGYRLNDTSHTGNVVLWEYEKEDAPFVDVEVESSEEDGLSYAVTVMERL